MFFLPCGMNRSDIQNLFTRLESERSPNYDCNSHHYENDRCWSHVMTLLAFCGNEPYFTRIMSYCNCLKSPPRAPRGSAQSRGGWLVAYVGHRTHLKQERLESFWARIRTRVSWPGPRSTTAPRWRNPDASCARLLLPAGIRACAAPTTNGSNGASASSTTIPVKLAHGRPRRATRRGPAEIALRARTPRWRATLESGRDVHTARDSRRPTRQPDHTDERLETRRGVGSYRASGRDGPRRDWYDLQVPRFGRHPKHLANAAKFLSDNPGRPHCDDCLRAGLSITRANFTENDVILVATEKGFVRGGGGVFCLRRGATHHPENHEIGSRSPICPPEWAVRAAWSGPRINDGAAPGAENAGSERDVRTAPRSRPSLSRPRAPATNGANCAWTPTARGEVGESVCATEKRRRQATAVRPASWSGPTAQRAEGSLIPAARAHAPRDERLESPRRIGRDGRGVAGEVARA